MAAKLQENIRAMYADAYKLHETLCDMGNSSGDWSDAALLCARVCEHHGNHSLMLDLAGAVYAHLEREREGDPDRT